MSYFVRESPINRVLFLHASEAESDMESSVTLGTKVSYACCVVLGQVYLAAVEPTAAAIDLTRLTHLTSLLH